MDCSVSRSTLSGSVSCPPNKSYTHRAVFLASMAGGGSVVEGALLSGDTLSTIEACRSMGAEVAVRGDRITVHKGVEPSGDVAIDAANSGTTIRMAAALASLYGHTATLTGDASLQERPMQPLLDALGVLGARCTSRSGRPPMTVSGPISGGAVSIRGNVSSQFVSALAMTAPMAPRGMDITIEGQMVSRPYLDMTLATMRRFGVSARTVIPYRSYEIRPARYEPARFTVPMDFSSLALLLSAAVLCGDGSFRVSGRMDGLPQGDEAFLDILELMRVAVSVGEDAVSVAPPERLGGGTFDLGNSPDLLPPLAILALKSEQPIIITGVEHARLKETDRISIISSELPKMGVRIDERPDGMTLHPPRRMRGAALDPRHDHRLFMAFCIAGMYAGDSAVSGAESAAVSYPAFVRDMAAAGGALSVA
ncbi:MAG: 3-phosphoshikimate 1-carboxyvinyltransferase [Nitrosopumilaceae archaeon]|nr:3-phosphoshikimate 1-carboxyvinyltransferase [Nitrosopumilaceae archaeon]